MKQKDFSIEDFVLDNYFRHWVLNPDRDSNIFWEAYIKEHPCQVEMMEKAREIIVNLPKVQNKLSEDEVLQIWKNIEAGMDAFAGPYTNVIPIHSIAVLRKQQAVQKWWYDYRKLGRYAAVIIFVMSAIVSWYLVNQQPARFLEQLVVKETPWGQKSIIYLSDGSEVILNSGSRIKYLEHFAPHERLVYLEGEAFFNVASDPERPFKVESSMLTTKAIGTSFNVNAYPDKRTIAVSVVSGKVRIFHDTISSLNLMRGESANYDRVNEKMEKSTYEYSALRWKDGIIVFRDDNQEVVFKKLSQWYGVEFKFLNNSNKVWNYNAEYKNLDLSNVLGAIAFAMDFDYRIQNDTVWIEFH